MGKAVNRSVETNNAIINVYKENKYKLDSNISCALLHLQKFLSLHKNDTKKFRAILINSLESILALDIMLPCNTALERTHVICSRYLDHYQVHKPQRRTTYHRLDTPKWPPDFAIELALHVSVSRAIIASIMKPSY